MRCLITGGSGYLGSVLIDRLLNFPEIDYIVNYDALFFGENVTKQPYGKYFLVNCRVEQMDWVKELDSFDSVDAVIWLAAISNDPASEINPTLTKLINHFSVIQLAYQCYQRGIKFIFASSASVYGAVNYACSRWSPTFPISLYASEKLETERDLWAMADDNWQPFILRMATLYGPSARLRLDLAINKMVFDAITTGELTVYGGQQYRPFLHVSHAVNSYIAALFNTSVNQGYIINVVDFNITILDLANIIGEYFDAKVRVESQNLDSRNYRMLPVAVKEPFDNMEWTEEFAQQLDMIKACVNKIENPNDTRYYTVKRIREVLEHERTVLYAIGNS